MLAQAAPSVAACAEGTSIVRTLWNHNPQTHTDMSSSTCAHVCIHIYIYIHICFSCISLSTYTYMYTHTASKPQHVFCIPQQRPQYVPQKRPLTSERIAQSFWGPQRQHAQKDRAIPMIWNHPLLLGLSTRTKDPHDYHEYYCGYHRCHCHHYYRLL